MNFLKKYAKFFTVALIGAIIIQSAAIPVFADETDTVYLGGQPFGVKFFSDGVMVVELEDFYNNGRYICPARDGGLEINDVIKEINGQTVRTNEDVQRVIFQCGGEPLKLTVERGGKELIKTINPKKNASGVYVSGAWVRDSCAGIGTVTFYDGENGCFAALGHGICDNDTSALMPLGSAEVVSVDISSVTKSSTGKAGSLNGCFSDKTLGSLTKNTNCGVFGKTEGEIPQNGKKLYSFIITDSENNLCLCTSTDKKSIKKEYFKLLSDKKYWNYHKKNKLPEFKYSGSDKVMKAVIEYEQARNDELLYSDNVWIPFFTELCRKDDGDELKVFVEIWQFEYQRQGDVLEGTNGGDGMAKYTLKKEKGGYKVIEVEYASDGALLEESIKKMSEGDASVYMKISGRTQPNYEFLDMYIRDNNLNVKYRRVNGEIA